MKNLKKYLTDQSGQMVIVVMLVLVIALTVGLSLISRTITNTRLSTNTENANRAYSAAEAGIEEALRPGGTVTGTGTQGLGATGANQSTYQTNTSTQGNTDEPFMFPNPFKKDEASQVWLFNYESYRNSSTFPVVSCPSGTNYFNECANRDITIYWGTPTGGAPNASTPALEVTLLYRDNANAFQVEKCAYDPYQTRSTSNNFSNAVSTADSTICNQSGANLTSGNFPLTNTSQGTKNYNFRKSLRLASASSTGRKYLLMRLKPLYNTTSHDIAVDPGDAVLPAQGQVIESTGNAGDVIRKIRVYQSYPTLPGVFDFVLFNGSDQPLEKNE